MPWSDQERAKQHHILSIFFPFSFHFFLISVFQILETHVSPGAGTFGVRFSGDVVHDLAGGKMRKQKVFYQLFYQLWSSYGQVMVITMWFPHVSSWWFPHGDFAETFAPFFWKSPCWNWELSRSPLPTCGGCTCQGRFIEFCKQTVDEWSEKLQTVDSVLQAQCHSCHSCHSWHLTNCREVGKHRKMAR